MSADALYDIDRQLEEDASTFISLDLLAAMDVLAADWEQLPRRHPGRDDYRVLVSPGNVVYAFSLDAQLDPDGVITVTSIAIDLRGPCAASGAPPMIPMMLLRLLSARTAG